MYTPVRIQRSRKVKQVSPNELPIVYVGRPSKFGNPYKIIKESSVFLVVFDNDEITRFKNKKDAIDCSVELFKEYISHCHNSGEVDISELIDKNLSCWCSLNCNCHANVLLELASTIKIKKLENK